MPFRSEAQRRYLYAKHPAVAKEFESATPKGAALPERVGEVHHGHQHMDKHAKAHLGKAGHPSYK